MAGNIYINLSEEIENDLLTRYQSLCDELSQTLGNMYTSLEEICTQTQYEPMVNLVNTTIDLFNNDIYNVATQTFEEWLEGEGSFSAVSENSQAGESAFETARQIETSIRETFDSFWSSHPLGENIQLDTGRPKIKSEDFDELKHIYEQFFRNIESTSEDAVSRIVELGSEDSTYNVMIPPIKALTEPIKQAFEQFSTKIDEAKEDSEGLKQQQDSKNDEASENATQTSASATDIAEALKMFDDI